MPPDVQPSHSASRSGVSKAQAARDVDAALGVVRGKRYPRINGFNSYGARLAIRVGWHARFFGRMPSGPVLSAMRPSHLTVAEGSLVFAHVHEIAEREGWLSS